MTAKAQTIPEMLKSLSSKPKDVGSIALKLGAKKNRRALSALYEIAADDKVDVKERAKVIRAISEIIDGREGFDLGAQKVFSSLSKDKSPLIRGFTAGIFQKIGGEMGRSLLKPLTSDSDPWVRQKAG